MAYYLGVDGGTESLRARIYDGTGNALASHAEPYATDFSAGARAEQNPEDWWGSLIKATRACLAEARLAGDQIAAMAYATTSCTVVALGSDHRPLRPSIIWMDVRASAEADAVLATGDARLTLNGAGRGPVSAEWMIPKALWIKRNEPEIYDRAATICEYQDYLTLRLTGERCASLNNVGLRWHYANREGGWATSLVTALGMADLVEKWPGRVVPPGEVVGPLTTDAAEALGLSSKTLLKRDACRTRAVCRLHRIRDGRRAGRKH
ncbi:MAG: FGGY family carbohydrate kinase [Pseudomonadota bacterium]